MRTILLSRPPHAGFQHVRALLAALAMFLLLAACAHPTPPGIGVRGITPGRIYLNMATLQIQADILNHDENPLHLTSAFYTLKVANLDLGTGHYAGSVELPPGATVGITFPLQLDYTRLVRAVAQAQHQHLVHDGIVNASLHGTFHFAGALGDATAPLDAIVALPVSQQAWGGTHGTPLRPGFESRQ